MKRLSVLLPTLCAVLVGLVGSTAHAAVYSKDSPRGITERIKGSPSAAQVNQADLRKLSYWNSRDRVHIRWQVQDLRSDLAQPSFLYDTGTSLKRAVWVFPNGAAQVRRPDGTVVCRSTAYKSFAENYVTASFPEGCWPRRDWFPAPMAESEFVSAGGSVWLLDRLFNAPGWYPNP